MTLTILDHYEYLTLIGEYQYDRLLVPFTVLLGLVTAFRLNDAFHKWEKAGDMVFTLQRECRLIMARLCAFLPKENDEVKESMLEIRRYLLLGAVLWKAHVRKEWDTSIEECLQCGLLTASDKKRLDKKTKVTIADGNTGDGKKDSYPSRSRPTYAFQEASLINHELFKAKHYTCPHTFWGIEQAIENMSNVFEATEHLATSLLPLPYAQLTRLLMLIFLCMLPVAYVSSLGWVMLPLSLLANLGGPPASQTQLLHALSLSPTPRPSPPLSRP